LEFSGFSKKTLPFLKAINPSRAFVSEMGEHLQALEPTINFSPKINKSLYRIYRDTRRMGANKTPLKHRIGFIFWQGNNKRMQSSSFYMHFSPDELMVATGVRWFEKPMLDAFREYILDDDKRNELEAILESIRAKGYTHLEKGYKRYPKGFNADMPNADLSLYKGMATFKVLDPRLIEDGKKLIDTLYKIYEDMLPLQKYMYEVSLRVKED